MVEPVEPVVFLLENIDFDEVVCRVDHLLVELDLVDFDLSQLLSQF